MQTIPDTGGGVAGFLTHWLWQVYRYFPFAGTWDWLVLVILLAVAIRFLHLPLLWKGVGEDIGDFDGRSHRRRGQAFYSEATRWIWSILSAGLFVFFWWYFSTAAAGTLIEAREWNPFRSPGDFIPIDTATASENRCLIVAFFTPVFVTVAELVLFIVAGFRIKARLRRDAAGYGKLPVLAQTAGGVYEVTLDDEGRVQLRSIATEFLPVLMQLALPLFIVLWLKIGWLRPAQLVFAMSFVITGVLSFISRRWFACIHWRRLRSRNEDSVHAL